MITLQDDLTCLTILPEVGGSLVAWCVLKSGDFILRETSVEDIKNGSARRLACYPLAPWSNRIDKQGFENPDGWLGLAKNLPGEPYPIHGSAWQKCWTVLQVGPQSALLFLETDDPFPYRAEQHISLKDGELSIELKVQHKGWQSAWYGLGLHPFFSKTAATLLQVGAAGVWYEASNRLPKKCVELPKAWDFSSTKILGNDLLIDHAFEGWNGICHIIQPDLGYRLECQAVGAERFILYTPLEKNFFCFEPVTHPINAHHMQDRPGLRLLSRDECLSINWSMKYIQI